MTTIDSATANLGNMLAARLHLEVLKRERHDLAGPCIACASSDAFRIHQHAGVAQCYSCGAKWSPLQLAEQVLGDRQQAKMLLTELGAFRPMSAGDGNANSASSDPLALIAEQKGIPPESLVAFGARATSLHKIQLPAYGPTGKVCTRFSISTRPGTRASKGLFALHKPAGLFFPHVDGLVRLPRPGEVWHLVEGVKDAAALHSLGLLACGMNTCR